MRATDGSDFWLSWRRAQGVWTIAEHGELAGGGTVDRAVQVPGVVNDAWMHLALVASGDTFTIAIDGGSYRDVNLGLQASATITGAALFDGVRCTTLP